MISEALLIKRYNPVLNKQLTKPGITHTLRIFDQLYMFNNVYNLYNMFLYCSLQFKFINIYILYYLIFCILGCFHTNFQLTCKVFLIMTNEESKRRLAINFKLKMCFSLNWYLKVTVFPPVFYFLFNYVFFFWWFFLTK